MKTIKLGFIALLVGLLVVACQKPTTPKEGPTNPEHSEQQSK